MCPRRLVLFILRPTLCTILISAPTLRPSVLRLPPPLSSSLQLCMSNAVLCKELKQAMWTCSGAIFCRMTPSQKARVVRIAKKDFGCVSLAIGDGANDVSMILESNVGVGIAGKEGSQAASSADFVLHRFQHLRRLLLVHGRYSYLRAVKLVRLIFFINVAFNLPQLWFSFVSAFSGQSIFPSVVLTCYSPLYMCPIWLGVGIFDKDLRPRTLLRFPQLYRALAWGNTHFGSKYFAMDIGFAVLHSAVGSAMIFITYIVDGVNAPRAGGMWAMGTANAAFVVSSLCLHNAQRITTWTR